MIIISYVHTYHKRIIFDRSKFLAFFILEILLAELLGLEHMVYMKLIESLLVSFPLLIQQVTWPDLWSKWSEARRCLWAAVDTRLCQQVM